MEPSPLGRSVEELFAEALELAPADRAHFLDTACGVDVALHSELESLLDSHAKAQVFFGGMPAISLPLGEASSVDPIVGVNIGNYRVLEPIATGGMGTVYLGERIDAEFRKRVAIKLTRPGLHSEQILARFRRERQVLADLEHPNICRLLDGGSTPDGRPYLVMEYVDGTTLDRHCDQHRLGVRERLGLFLTACEAVHFAHQNLVVHRDLKPSNILVDKSGVVKLLDFGIAKLLDTDEAATDLTLTNLRAFTPRYASPEQVSGERITTATDIYSLGIVLYELLTGRSPRSATRHPNQSQGLIVAGRFLRPSRAVTLLSAIWDSCDTPAPTELSALRNTTPQRLARTLTGDLDTILERALSPEPERRYSSVQVFADDLRRHLAGEPVQARPDTAYYRISRFARRQKALVFGIAAVFVILVASLLATANAYRQAHQSMREARWLAYVSALSAGEASLIANKLPEAKRRLASAPMDLRGWEWRHLHARLDRSRQHWQAHKEGVTGMKYSAGGQHLLTTSLDGTVQIRNVANGHPLATFGPWGSGVEGAELSPDGKLLAVGLNDGRVLLGTTSGPVRFDTLLKVAGWARASFRPDGREIAIGSLDGSVHVWDPWKRLPLGQWNSDEQLVIPLYDPTGRFLATGGSDGVLRLWDAHTHVLRRTIAAHTRRIYALAWSHDGTRVATGSMDHTAAIWSPSDGRRLATLREHRGTVAALAFQPGDAGLITTGADGRVLAWNAASASLVTELRGHSSDVSAVAISPDGKTVATGDWSGSIQLWDWGVEDVRTLVIPGARSEMQSAIDPRFSPSGQRVLCTTNTGRVWIWDRSNWLARSFVLHDSRRALLLPGDSLVVAANGAGDLIVQNVNTDRRVRSIRAHRAAISALDLNVPAQRLATGSQDSVVKLWNLPDLSFRASLPFPGAVRDAAFSPDGSLLALAGGAGVIQIRKGDTGELLRTLAADSVSILDLAFHPGGQQLASVSAHGRLLIWDLVRGSPRPIVFDGRGTILSVAFSPDGTRLATGHTDEMVRIFEANSGRELLDLHGHVGRVGGLTFSDDGTLLVSAARDGTMRVWDAASETAITTRQPIAR